MTVPAPRRPPLSAVVHGMPAAWLWRRVKDDAAKAPAAVAAAVAHDRGEEAGRRAGTEMSWMLAQIREAARQWEERHGEAGSVDGTAELVVSGSGGRSGHELTTTEAADLLGVTPEMVRRYCRSGLLVADQRGRSWVIDRGSVGDLRDARAQRRAAA